MPWRGSILAILLYAIGGAALLISLFLLSWPSRESFSPALIGFLLSVIILALARISQHLAAIRARLERRL